MHLKLSNYRFKKNLYNREPCHVLKIIIKHEHLGNKVCCLCRCLAKCIFLPAFYLQGGWRACTVWTYSYTIQGRLWCATSAIAQHASPFFDTPLTFGSMTKFFLRGWEESFFYLLGMHSSFCFTAYKTIKYMNHTKKIVFYPLGYNVIRYIDCFFGWNYYYSYT